MYKYIVMIGRPDCSRGTWRLGFVKGGFKVSLLGKGAYRVDYFNQ